MKQKYEQKPVNWKHVLSESGITQSYLLIRLAAFGYIIPKSTFSDWISGRSVMPDLIYGYLLSYFEKEI